MNLGVVPLVVLVAGLLLWTLSSNAKASEAGRIMFFCGLLALCFSLGAKAVHL